MFSSISNWFAPKDSNRPSRRNLAMNSTRDAFSLPTHSPTVAQHNYPSRAQSTDQLDPEPLGTPSYTYPPTSNDDPYNYLANTSYDSGPKSARSSLLPLHHTALPPLQLYPPLASTWHRIREWLSEESAELADTLNYGVLEQTLQEVESTLGFALPSSVRESYLVTDGQEPETLNGAADGLFFGLTFLPLEEALEEWKFWREVDIDPNTGSNSHLREKMQSIPPGYIQREYSQRGWFPIITDKAGNYLGVDMNPDESGSVGQVIVFGRDFDMKVVMWKAEGEGGWGRWLAAFAEELETGEGFEVGNRSSDGSDGSDDGLGYDGYFFDPSARTRAEGGISGASAGLRLTGEYRGWPVLEAWADKSYRRWREVGQMNDKLLPNLPLEPSTNEKAVIHDAKPNQFESYTSFDRTDGRSDAPLSSDPLLSPSLDLQRLPVPFSSTMVSGDPPMPVDGSLEEKLVNTDTTIELTSDIDTSPTTPSPPKPQDLLSSGVEGSLIETDDQEKAVLHGLDASKPASSSDILAPNEDDTLEAGSKIQGAILAPAVQVESRQEYAGPTIRLVGSAPNDSGISEDSAVHEQGNESPLRIDESADVPASS